jgi:hypothetical protein
MRAIMVIAAWEGLAIKQMDVDSAYLNKWMDTNVYMTQPTSFVDLNHLD